MKEPVLTLARTHTFYSLLTLFTESSLRKLVFVVAVLNMQLDCLLKSWVVLPDNLPRETQSAPKEHEYFAKGIERARSQMDYR